MAKVITIGLTTGEVFTLTLVQHQGEWVGEIETNLLPLHVGELETDEYEEELTAALNAVESLVLAHACAGVDVESQPYCIGLETSLEAINNRYA